MAETKIIAVIPAYNEADRIGAVLEAVLKVDLIDKVIVVNDGSKDQTFKIAKAYPVLIIDHKKNHGKGRALESGINLARKSDVDILVFLDADLINLRPGHIKELIETLLKNNELLMTVGILKRRGNKDTTPEYSGQRAIKVEFFDHSLDLSRLGFGVELALTNRLKKIAKKRKVKETNLRQTVIFTGVTHIPKEEKFGPIPGFRARMKMVGDISVTPLYLMRADLEKVLIDMDKLIKDYQLKRNVKKEEKELKQIKKKLTRIEKKWQKRTRKLS